MRAPALPLAGALLAGVLAAAPARADIWGYIDDKGVAHFAAEKRDDRYELFFRGAGEFDTRAGVRPPREVAVPVGSGARLLAWFEISAAYKAVKHHLRDAAREHGVDYELLKALIATESGFDAAAVSPKGAVGLMQVIPATGERYGLRGDVARQLADPRTNIRTGSRYLRDLMRMFPGRLELALAAYNAGEGAVQRAGHRIPDYRETQNYVRTVLQLYAMLKPPNLAPTARVPHRIRMELPGPPGPTLGPEAAGEDPLVLRGGALGRGNMPGRLPPELVAPAAGGPEQP